MDFLDKNLETTLNQLYGFSVAIIEVNGSIRLLIILGKRPLSSTQVTEWLVIINTQPLILSLAAPYSKNEGSDLHLSLSSPGSRLGSQYGGPDSMEINTNAKKRG